MPALRRFATTVALFLFAAATIAHADTTAPSKTKGKPVTTPSGLKYWELKKGSGAVAKAGDSVQVHYTGWLTEGKKFDSSVDRGSPFVFKLGAGMAIMEMPIITRSTLMRPSLSDIQPDRIRPEALPKAPTTMGMAVIAAAAMPTLLANGTSWLMTMRPAEQPSA